MAHPYNNKSPFNCWKGYERVPGTKPGAKGSCRKSSPANQNHYGESRGEGHKSGERQELLTGEKNQRKNKHGTSV